MIKKIGIPILALAALVGFGAPRTAKAADVHFGISIGAPVYTAPAPVYPYTPYVAPYYSYTWGNNWRGHDRDHHDWDRHDRGHHDSHDGHRR